jgi:HAD superfamily hydrolase (TIGR01509 family)
MTSPAVAAVADVLRRAHYLLLDFDGPICSIFAGRPAATIAHELVDALRADDVPVPPAVDDTADPFDVLRYAGTVSPEVAHRTEARLREAELDAVSTASPTPGLHDLVTMWHTSGRLIGAVSNNSALAVSAYLSQHDLEFDSVVGRTRSDPTLLKPNPHLVRLGVQQLGADPRLCVLVGDSPSDVSAALAAGAVPVGFANKPHKYSCLAAAGAGVIVGGLDAMIYALR